MRLMIGSNSFFSRMRDMGIYYGLGFLITGKDGICTVWVWIVYVFPECWRSLGVI